jgi:Kef-type K+ transport system membrane component KefB
VRDTRITSRRERLSDGEIGPEAGPRHSGLGVSSFIIAIVAGLVIFVTVVAIVAKVIANQGRVDEKSPEMILAGLLILGCIGLDLLALVLGICGLFQKDRQKVFAILGVVLSALTLFGLSALMVLGTLG